MIEAIVLIIIISFFFYFCYKFFLCQHDYKIHYGRTVNDMYSGHCTKCGKHFSNLVIKDNKIQQA